MIESGTESARLTVWVDADSCPREVRNLLNRAAPRRGFDLVYCANRQIGGLHDLSERRELRVVSDETVDEYLIRVLESASIGTVLLVTRDIPLAEQIVHLGLAVINDRGDRFDEETIADRRSIRDAGVEIRRLGIEQMPRSRSYGAKEQKAFADSLDRVLTELLK